MLDLTFAEFYAANYDDSHDVGVYVVRNGETLYVGMSTSNIWNRWFYGTYRSHMEQSTAGMWYGNTAIGRKVASNMPDSWNWRIELWRIEDCIDVFGDYLSAIGFRTDRIDVRTAEQVLMKHYHPSLNLQA